jgi:hypothetical protein
VTAPEGPCAYCELDPCQCAAIEREVDQRLEADHYTELGWSE